MVLLPVLGPRCHTAQVSKGGTPTAGHQRYKCHNADYPQDAFHLDTAYKGRLPAIKQHIIAMRLNGSGMRETARVLQRSPTTVMNGLKKLGRQNQLEEVCFKLRKMRYWIAAKASTQGPLLTAGRLCLPPRLPAPDVLRNEFGCRVGIVVHHMHWCGRRVPGRDDRGTVWQSPSGEAIMRKRLRDNGLSLTMFGLFLLFLAGHSLAGYYDYNADQQAYQQPAVGYGAYLTSSHFWATVFENWESEFLQMAAYVLLTVFLVQRGSAESKDPDTSEEVDEDPRHHQLDPTAPGPVRKGGIALMLYAHSLSLALGFLFLLSFLGHAASGTKHYNEVQHAHGQPPVSLLQYVGTARF